MSRRECVRTATHEPRLRQRVVEVPQPYFTFGKTFSLDANLFPIKIQRLRPSNR